jgi:subtilisin family serine protease
VLVGDEAGGTAIGVAPQAQWIAAKIFNDAGGSTATAAHAAFQWMLDPDANPGTADAPQVVNNSWGFTSPGCNLEFQPDVQALRAAGILPVFAAGNSGPNPSTSVSPANYPEAFAVGNTNDSDVIANDSSRGPSACGESQTIYPEIVAPGVSIRTTDLFGLYFNASGTSVAAPHVAGALALLLSAFPNLSVDQQSAALTTTAVDLGPAGPDNTYGAGRLNVLAAYDSLVPVGGIADLPDIARQPGGAAGAWPGGSAALAVGLAATLVALTTGAWYARRRWGWRG